MEPIIPKTRMDKTSKTQANQAYWLCHTQAEHAAAAENFARQSADAASAFTELRVFSNSYKMEYLAGGAFA
ncbi:MAG: hypothetical protein KBI46_06595 [Phycisphaerae bacterium]|nr:hypothetical protein [Phycisphaerae bacterium]